MLRVVLEKLAEGVMVPLYDQPVIVENAGSIVIAQYGERIGLVQSFRMVGERIFPDAGANYIKELASKNGWKDLLKSLGRWCWESPRGLIPGNIMRGEMEDLKSFVVRTAKLEALEEGGFKVDSAKLMGTVNANSTFFLHPQYVVWANVVSTVENTPENLEIIGGKRFFSMEELRQLNQAGEFDDGLTLAAIALCGMHL
jgi:hypothetical protein